MKFTDRHVFAQDRFSIGIEESSGKYYLSIPVANPYVEYEEYYEIDAAQFAACPSNLAELRAIATRCRERKNDARLLVAPGRLRGTPV